ncbi:MAG: BON domain-containing protein [Gemmatimonadota bacterium]
MKGKAWAFLGGVGVGALAMYFLDPESGDDRRAAASDRLVIAGRRSGEAIEGRARQLARGASTAARRAGARLKGEPANEVLAQRVRSSLDSVIAHPRRVNVSVEGGTVTLAGIIEEEEASGLTAAVRAVSGVKDVIDRTQVRAEVAR